MVAIRVPAPQPGGVGIEFRQQVAMVLADLRDGPLGRPLGDGEMLPRKRMVRVAGTYYVGGRVPSPGGIMRPLALAPLAAVVAASEPEPTLDGTWEGGLAWFSHAPPEIVHPWTMVLTVQGGTVLRVAYPPGDTVPVSGSIASERVELVAGGTFLWLAWHGDQLAGTANQSDGLTAQAWPAVFGRAA